MGGRGGDTQTSEEEKEKKQKDHTKKRRPKKRRLLPLRVTMGYNRFSLGPEGKDPELKPGSPSGATKNGCQNTKRSMGFALDS